MTVVERQMIIASKAANGDTIMHFPVTHARYVEGAAHSYNCIADMLNDSKLGINTVCQTIGYHTKNDDGGGTYIIRAKSDEDIENGGTILLLNNGLVAELITNGIINVRQFGAKGDGVTDDAEAFRNAYNAAVSKGTKPFVPFGTYLLNSAVQSVKPATFYCDGVEPQYTGKYLFVTKPMYDNEMADVLLHARTNFRKAYRLNDASKIPILLEEAEKLKKYCYDNGFTYGHYNTIPMEDANTIDCSGFCFWVLHNIGFTELAGMQPYEHQDLAQSKFFDDRPESFTKITSINSLQAGDIVFMGTSSDKFPRHKHMYIYVDKNSGYSTGNNDEIQQPSVVNQCLHDLYHGGVMLTGYNYCWGGTENNHPLTIGNDLLDKNNFSDTNEVITNVRFVDKNYALLGSVSHAKGTSNNAFSLKKRTNNNTDMGVFIIENNDDSSRFIRLIANGTSETSMILYSTVAYMGSNFAPLKDNAYKLGSTSQRWSQLYAGTATINTSDERHKINIADVDTPLMRAWSKVNYKVFQFRDAFDEKGANARLHIGVIAQEVIEAFKEEGLDAFRYGLLCYDEWEDQYEDVEVIDQYEEVDPETGEVILPFKSHTEKRLVVSAGNLYGIRYEEALALECAYQRWLGNQILQSLNDLKHS